MRHLEPLEEEREVMGLEWDEGDLHRFRFISTVYYLIKQLSVKQGTAKQFMIFIDLCNLVPIIIETGIITMGG